MYTYQIRNSLETLVSQGEIDKALKKCLELYSNTILSNQFILLSSRWEKLKSNKNKGILTNENINVENNQITADLLEAIEKTGDVETNTSIYASQNDLDDKSKVILIYLLEDLKKDEENQVIYPHFEKTEIRSWVVFDASLSRFQYRFNEDLFLFLNNGINLNYNLRTRLISSINEVLGVDNIDFSNNRNRMEKTIVEMILKNKIEATSEVIEKFIEASLINIGFDFQGRIVTYLKEFAERFANKEDITKNESTYGSFLSCFNKTLGISDSPQVHQIVRNIIARESLKEVMLPMVEKIIEEIQKERKVNDMLINNEVLKLYLEEQEQKIQEIIKANEKSKQNFEKGKTTKNTLANMIFIASATAIWAIIIYHLTFHSKMVNYDYNALNNNIKKLKSEDLAIRKKIDSMAIQTREFDRQNIKIIRGIEDIKKQILKNNK